MISMLKVPGSILVSDILFLKIMEKLALLFQVGSVLECKLGVVMTQELGGSVPGRGIVLSRQ